MLNRKPMLLVLAGPNGSGKSTITKYFEIQGIYTNADEVVASTGMDNKKAALSTFISISSLKASFLI